MLDFLRVLKGGQVPREFFQGTQGEIGIGGGLFRGLQGITIEARGRNPFDLFGEVSFENLPLALGVLAECQRETLSRFLCKQEGTSGAGGGGPGGIPNPEFGGGIMFDQQKDTLLRGTRVHGHQDLQEEGGFGRLRPAAAEQGTPRLEGGGKGIRKGVFGMDSTHRHPGLSPTIQNCQASVASCLQDAFQACLQT